MSTSPLTSTVRLERPDVLVTLGYGDEVEGELSAWKQAGDGSVGSAQWRRSGQHTRTDLPTGRPAKPTAIQV